MLHLKRSEMKRKNKLPGFTGSSPVAVTQDADGLIYR